MIKIKIFFLVLWRFIKRFLTRLFQGDGSGYNAPKQASGSLTNARQISGQSFWQKWIKQYKLLWIILGCLILGLFLWQYKLNFLPQKSVSEGIIGIYTTKNLPATVTNLLSRSLVSLDKSGTPQPNLAEKWEADKESKIYTFTLRDNLYWNDGTKIKSSDIAFSLPDVEVTYPDDKTIVFKLADTFAPFPALLTTPVFKGQSLTGTGDYLLTDQEINRDLVLKMKLTPISFNKALKLPNVIIRFYPDEKTAKTAFELGEVDSLIGVSEAAGLANQTTIQLKKIVNFNKIVAVFYNTKDPILSDKNLRKALSYASPSVSGEVEAISSIPKGSWAFNDSLIKHTADLESAKLYLNKVEKGAESTITLTTTPSLSNLGEKIVQEWKKAGLQAVLRIESGVPQNFQALLISQSIPSDPDQYALWHSTQSRTNLSKFVSDRVDKDLEDGRKSMDSEVRKEKYFDLQKKLLDDAPATFLYFPQISILYRKSAGPDLEKILQLQLKGN